MLPVVDMPFLFQSVLTDLSPASVSRLRDSIFCSGKQLRLHGSGAPSTFAYNHGVFGTSTTSVASERNDLGGVAKPTRSSGGNCRPADRRR